MKEDKKEKTAEDIEREGFTKMTAVALGANIAAATIHSGRMLEWNKLVPQAMAGAHEFWKAIKEDRDVERNT